MPPLRYYTVTQVREVKVSATDEVIAADLATRVLENKKNPSDQINVQSWPKIISLIVQEESHGER
jgi:hypothetical protein